jgi:hypothetical protein
VRRVAGLRWCFQLVSDVLQVFTERAYNVRANVGAQDDLALRRDSADQVRQLKASVFQALADERIRFAKYFIEYGNGVLGHAAI